MSLNGKFVWRSARTFRVLLAVACVACTGASARDAATPIDFGKNEIGTAPARLALSPGLWTAVHAATTDAGIATEQPAVRKAKDRYALAIYQTASIKNAEINLRLEPAGGKSEERGIAVRLSDPQNYYLVQVDAQSDRVLFARVSNGVSEEIVGVDADIASQAWHTLTVRAVDNEFTVSLDGDWVFTAFDKTLSQAGRIALWSKGDSVTRFDQIEVAPLP